MPKVDKTKGLKEPGKPIKEILAVRSVMLRVLMLKGIKLKTSRV